MALKKSNKFCCLKWHWILCALSAVAFLFCILSLAFIASDFLLNTAASLLVLVVFTAIFAILAALYQLQKNLCSLNETLVKTADTSARSSRFIEQLAHDIRLSETTRSIIFRDTDRLTLGEAVLAKLHQKDFTATYEMIEAMETRTEYKSLAEKLKNATDKYKNANDDERINQVIAHIESLAADQHWVQASAQTQRLRKLHPDSDKVRQLPNKLRDLKENKKCELLKAWEAATQMGDTDKSIEILKELDMYLTPSEGLALQETASGIFRDKLQSLGVRFSLAISDEQWSTALETGQEIIKNFPNSRMAHEISAKIEALKERAAK